MSEKFKRKTLLYKHFALLFGQYDFSDQRLLDLYNHESYGTDLPQPDTNGFAVGKKWLNWHITNWKHGLVQGSITRNDLIASIPDVDGYAEMIDSVLRDAFDGHTVNSVIDATTWWHIKPPS